MQILSLSLALSPYWTITALSLSRFVMSACVRIFISLTPYHITERCGGWSPSAQHPQG